MKKLLALATLSLAVLGLSNSMASAWWFNPCCHKCCATICCKPYNAFSPCCPVTVRSHGCCPVLNCCGNGGCGNSCYSGGCDAGGCCGADGAVGQLPNMDGSGAVVNGPNDKTLFSDGLGEFFDEWGQPLGPDQVGPAKGHVTALYNGKVYRGNPRDIPSLAPLAEREILYRLLTGEQGPRLRQIAHAGRRLQQVNRAIAWIRAHFDQPFRIEATGKANDLPFKFNTLISNPKELIGGALSPVEIEKEKPSVSTYWPASG